MYLHECGEVACGHAHVRVRTWIQVSSSLALHLKAELANSARLGGLQDPRSYLSPVRLDLSWVQRISTQVFTLVQSALYPQLSFQVLRQSGQHE